LISKEFLKPRKGEEKMIFLGYVFVSGTKKPKHEKGRHGAKHRKGAEYGRLYHRFAGLKDKRKPKGK
jgi:hypothetical protein